MPKFKLDLSQSLAGVFLLLTSAVLPTSSARAACEFSIVKQQIDAILDKDAQKAAKFRAEIVDGSDSMTVIEDMVGDDMRDKLDVCRFEAGEYLTKRGFPPFH